MRTNDFKAIMPSFLHHPYQWGAKTPLAMDCSGLVQLLLQILGVDPPEDQNAQMYYTYFHLTSTLNARETGALAFYGSSITDITHIAMFFDETTVIEAGGGGSKTINIYDATKQNAFVRLRPYNKRKDLVAILLPDAIKNMLV